MRLISRSQLAELAGVSRPAITKACDSGKLKPACKGDGVDVDHPSVVAYLGKRGFKPPAAPSSGAGKSKAPPPQTDGAPTRPAKSKPAPAAEPTPSPKRGRGRPRLPPQDRPETRGDFRQREGVSEGSNNDLQDLDDALTPLIERFGTHFQFSSWLSSLKDIELIREKRLKNSETEGSVISRELVKTFVFGALEQAHKRLLGDAAKTTASKVWNSARAKGTLEEAQRIVREETSKQLKPIKATAARHLRNKTDGSA
jgi:hypothetical protein